MMDEILQRINALCIGVIEGNAGAAEPGASAAARAGWHGDG